MRGSSELVPDKTSYGFFSPWVRDDFLPCEGLSAILGGWKGSIYAFADFRSFWGFREATFHFLAILRSVVLANRFGPCDLVASRNIVGSRIELGSCDLLRSPIIGLRGLGCCCGCFYPPGQFGCCRGFCFEDSLVPAISCVLMTNLSSAICFYAATHFGVIIIHSPATRFGYR